MSKFTQDTMNILLQNPDKIDWHLVHQDTDNISLSDKIIITSIFIGYFILSSFIIFYFVPNM